MSSTRNGVPDVGDPARYRLVVAASPLSLQEFIATHPPDGPPGRPVRGKLWSRVEFLDQQWVAEWVAESEDAECFCLGVFERYGAVIPADLVVLDALAEDFQGFETIGREASWVQAAHVRAFTGIRDLREALHLMYRDDWITPLDDGTVIAPRISLEFLG
ncbi:MAG: hypothetical protein ABIS86_01355 [Streptosporangiaceae bacterium]